MTISLSSKATRIDSQVWNMVLPINAKDVKGIIEDGNMRIVCEISPTVSFNGALLPDGQGNFYILLNSDRRKKLGIGAGQEILFKITKDTSELGMPMSEEFGQVLDQFPQAKAAFDACTPGKKRTLIYWSDNVKSSQIKIRRAMVMCQHLEKNGKKVDFKLLNQEIKEANRLAKLKEV